MIEGITSGAIEGTGCASSSFTTTSFGWLLISNDLLVELIVTDVSISSLSIDSAYK